MAIPNDPASLRRALGLTVEDERRALAEASSFLYQKTMWDRLLISGCPAEALNAGARFEFISNPAGEPGRRCNQGGLHDDPASEPAGSTEVRYTIDRVSVDLR